MAVLRIVPALLSCLLISAHFQRGGYQVLAGMCLLAPTILLFRTPWATRVTQALLVLFVVEWLRTLLFLVHLRIENSLPWVRLTFILSGVVLFTFASIALLPRRTWKK